MGQVTRASLPLVTLIFFLPIKITKKIITKKKPQPTNVVRIVGPVFLVFFSWAEYDEPCSLG